MIRYYDIFEDKKAAVIDGRLFIEADEVPNEQPPARHNPKPERKSKRRGGRRRKADGPLVVGGITANILRLTREGKDPHEIAELTGSPLSTIRSVRSRFKNKEVQLDEPTEHLEDFSDDEADPLPETFDEELAELT